MEREPVQSAVMNEKRERIVAGVLYGLFWVILSAVVLSFRFWNDEAGTILRLDVLLIASVVGSMSAHAPRLASRSNLRSIAPFVLILIAFRTLLASLGLGWFHPWTLGFPICFIVAAAVIDHWWNPHGTEVLSAWIADEGKSQAGSCLTQLVGFCVFVCGCWLMLKGSSETVAISGFLIALVGTIPIGVGAAKTPVLVPKGVTRKGIIVAAAFYVVVIGLQIGIVGAAFGWTDPRTYFMPALCIAVPIAHLIVKWLF